MYRPRRTSVEEHRFVEAPMALENTDLQRHTPVLIRSARTHGVWHVTRDNVFLGDYLSQDAAQSAAAKAVKDIQLQGRSAEIVIG